LTDADIKLLTRLTLLTPTASTITITIPFFKKFLPQATLTHNETLFLPIFHTLKLDTPTEYA
jgi:hypothetical protein